MEILPLSSLDALLSWNGPGNLKNFLKGLPPLHPRSPPTSLLDQCSGKKFKTLVCHDMCNGYKDDKYCFRTSNSHAYKFCHWNAIDTFVYFSHHFVTIPPCGWVSAGHIHGVKVLGTLITEWDEGETIWDTILNDPAICELALNNLVEIAQTYRFEGWLLNIENKINPEKIKDLLYFASELTQRMRIKNSDSEVIWYDSVTIKGELKWQNELNENNIAFFNSCNSIFLNYTWNEDHLKRSVQVAQSRLTDVYVGVDMYGRNFYKGGGFNTNKAFEVIRKYNLSAALFAQGWTYEVLGAQNFFSNENIMWNSLEPFMQYHGPSSLPLTTSFCQGFGHNMFRNGKVLNDGKWFNLMKQQIQPIWEEVFRSSSNRTSITTNEAYNGGSCLSVWVDELTKIKLLVCQISITNITEFTFAYQCRGTIKYVAFTFSHKVTSECGDDEREVIMVAEKTEEKGEGAQVDDLASTILSPNSKDEKNSWSIRTFLLPVISGCLCDFKLVAQGPGVVFFGEVSIRHFFP
ncbi:Cytosolic endo-beta-N-acetylglucosaminidase [Armadillidium nasatum]|uniref:Cytosolic endo-beta-N-acetylglucosaminidase n=1 Tax=Armadillidium nasatum TaxID=96803 RepID=A0A5N5T935_9CRUS|nr:Cytosolic endo-beta-N-acetylglucosaminidase [Armadillidium nasatum]